MMMMMIINMLMRFPMRSRGDAHSIMNMMIKSQLKRSKNCLSTSGAGSRQNCIEVRPVHGKTRKGPDDAANTSALIKGTTRERDIERQRERRESDDERERERERESFHAGICICIYIYIQVLFVVVIRD